MKKSLLALGGGVILALLAYSISSTMQTSKQSFGQPKTAIEAVRVKGSTLVVETTGMIVATMWYVPPGAGMTGKKENLPKYSAPIKSELTPAKQIWTFEIPEKQTSGKIYIITRDQDGYEYQKIINENLLWPKVPTDAHL